MSELIIAFEGTDCSFKETNTKKLKEYLESKGKKVLLYSFPNYESESSYLLRNYFKKLKDKQELSPENISMLYAFDFYNTWYNEINDRYSEEDILILDRWIYSNIYYQGVRLLQNKLGKDKLSIGNLKYYIDDHDLDYFINWYYEVIDRMNLPKADIVIKMIHDKIPTRGLIESRKSENNINEDDFNYLEIVNEYFKSIINFSGNTLIKEIYLDKDHKEFRSEEEIFNDILLSLSKDIETKVVI